MGGIVVEKLSGDRLNIRWEGEIDPVPTSPKAVWENIVINKFTPAGTDSTPKPFPSTSLYRPTGPTSKISAKKNARPTPRLNRKLSGRKKQNGRAASSTKSRTLEEEERE